MLNKQIKPYCYSMVHSWFIMKRDSKIVHPPMSLAGFLKCSNMQIPQKYLDQRLLLNKDVKNCLFLRNQVH